MYTSNIDSKLKKTKSFSICDVFFVYWFVLVIWQNISSLTSKSGFDSIIKAFLLISLVFYFHLKSNKLHLKHFIIVLFVMIYFLILLFNETNYSFSTLTSYFFPPIFAYLVYCVGNSFQVSENQYHRYLKFLIAVVWYMVIYSFIFEFNKFLNVFSISSAYGNELTSFFVSNHEYAMYLFFSIVSCFILLIKNKRNNFKKFFYIFSVFVFGINLILTYSRTALLACFVMIFIFICIDKSKLKKWLISLIIISIFVILCSSSIRSYIYTIVFKENNDAGRLDLINIAINKFNSSSFFIKVFGNGYSSTYSFLKQVTSHGSVHNAYLQVLLTNGIIGLFLLLFLLINNIIQALKMIKTDRFYGAIFSGLAFSLVFFMLTNTAVIFYSPIDSSMMTIFAVIIPKYFRNWLYKNRLLDRTSKEKMVFD